MAHTDREQTQPADRTAPPEGVSADPPPAVQREHSVQIGGRALAYRTVAEHFEVTLEGAEAKARLFTVSYFAEAAPGQSDPRPVLFCFNGGPGSSSVWLHVGALGPRRVDVTDLGGGRPPFQLIDNAQSPLDRCDLVFIDPAGTGFSEVLDAAQREKFYDLEGDIASVGRLIERWLTAYDRWDSPRFLCGESYGTARAAGVAHWLGERGVSLNGLVLISVAIDANTFLWQAGLEAAYAFYLPSYAVSAWHHGKVRGESVAQVAEAARAFAQGPYLSALFAGDRLDAAAREALLADLERHTGLAQRHWARHDLRIDQPTFCRLLLEDDGQVVGRFDSRYTAAATPQDNPQEPPDPSYDQVVGPFTAALNTLLRRELGLTQRPPYEVLSLPVNEGWRHERKWWQSAYNLSDRLRTVMLAQPYLRLLVLNGWYDLATPFFATEYTLSHLGAAASPGRIESVCFESGHMMYLHPPSRLQMKAQIDAFVAACTA